MLLTPSPPGTAKPAQESKTVNASSTKEAKRWNPLPPTTFSLVFIVPFVVPFNLREKLRVSVVNFVPPRVKPEASAASAS